MNAKTSAVFGLVVRAGPYQQRSARCQLDVALVCAAMEIPIRLYFLGSAVLQLIEKRDPVAARLPPGYRGWASLCELTEVRAFAESDWVERLRHSGLAPMIELESMSVQSMRSDWDVCDRMLVL